MDKKEAAATLKSHAEFLKNSRQLSPDAKVMEAIGFAMAVLEAGTSEYEYAMFSWNLEKGEYEQTGRPMQSELLARNRFNESVKNGWFGNRYDTSSKDLIRSMAWYLQRALLREQRAGMVLRAGRREEIPKDTQPNTRQEWRIISGVLPEVKRQEKSQELFPNISELSFLLHNAEPIKRIMI